MKYPLVLFFVAVQLTALAQYSESEKRLRNQSADTSQGWHNGGVVNLGFSQTSLYNWAAGGQNAISLNGLLSVFANQRKGKGVWENTLDLGYGVLKQGKDANWWKTDDKLDLSSKYGQKAFNNWYYAMLLNFKTQLSSGYNYPNDSVKISDFFAPAYLLAALGFDYVPVNDLSFFLAPLTGKATFVTDRSLADAGAFGVDPAVYDSSGNKLTSGKTSRTELGGYLRFSLKKELMANIILQTKVDLFSNYIKDPGNIDINWEGLITMKVNKYISVTLSTQLIYDHDIDVAIDTDNNGNTDKNSPITQFKEVLTAGFSYTY